jgi:hypothetical protein
MYLFGQPNRNTGSESPSENLFEHVALQNGPLMDFHPQMLLQCLLWGEARHSAPFHSDDLRIRAEKVELVKDIIVNLARDIESGQIAPSSHSVPLEDFLRNNVAQPVRRSRFSPTNLGLIVAKYNRRHSKHYTSLFEGHEQTDE